MIDNISDIHRKLLSFKNLKDNWDTYGAIAPKENAIEAAIDFLLKEVSTFRLPIYFTAPGVNGEVMLEFKGADGKAAELYFNPDESTELLLFQFNDCEFEGSLKNDFNQFLNFIN
jgi:hypothetical protein